MSRTESIDRLNSHGFGVVEDGHGVIVISGQDKKSIARRWESPRVAVETLIEFKGFCCACGVALTSTDWQAGRCAQCFKVF